MKENQESFRLLFKQLKKAACIMCGQAEEKGTVTFGLEDPYYTGQILAGAKSSLPHSFIKRLTLQPVF